MSSSSEVDSGNLNKWNVNAKKFSISEIVYPWSRDNYPWALEVKVDSVDPLKTGKTNGTIYFAAKLSDATGVIRCIAFHDAEVISRRFKVGGTYRIENANPKEVNPNFVRDGRFVHKCEIMLPANNLIWCVVESGFPPPKVRKVVEKVDDVLPSTSLMKESVGSSSEKSPISLSSGKEIEYTSLFLKSIVNDHWGFPVCRYTADCMQKLEPVGKSYKCTSCDMISDDFDWHLSILLNVFDGLSDLEVVATSTNAEKILGVTSLFVGKCVRENELEKLKGVAMAASNKLFNLSFLATKPGQTVTHKRVDSVSECFISGAEAIIKKMLYNESVEDMDESK